MALKDVWEQERQQRLQELRTRQVQVRTDIATWQQDREEMAAQQRKSLIDYSDKIKQETQELLSLCRDQRDRQAQELMQRLYEFTTALTAETAQFLSETTANRSLMATQQAKDLQDFSQKLRDTVAQLYALLYQQKEQRNAELDELRSDVESYLQELQLLGEQRSRQLQETFAEYRHERSQTMQTLSQSWEQLHITLQQYVTDLEMKVWGSAKPTDVQTFDRKQKIQPPKKPTAKVVIERPRPVATPKSPATPAPPKTIPSSPSQPATVKTTQAKSTVDETVVYDYIKQSTSARLKDIEEALNINRIETVDVLRSLMSKGLISQNNRIYTVVAEN